VASVWPGAFSPANGYPAACPLPFLPPPRPQLRPAFSAGEGGRWPPAFVPFGVVGPALCPLRKAGRWPLLLRPLAARPLKRCGGLAPLRIRLPPPATCRHRLRALAAPRGHPRLWTAVQPCCLPRARWATWRLPRLPLLRPQCWGCSLFGNLASAPAPPAPLLGLGWFRHITVVTALGSVAPFRPLFAAPFYCALRPRAHLVHCCPGKPARWPAVFPVARCAGKASGHLGRRHKRSPWRRCRLRPLTADNPRSGGPPVPLTPGSCLSLVAPHSQALSSALRRLRCAPPTLVLLLPHASHAGRPARAGAILSRHGWVGCCFGRRCGGKPGIVARRLPPVPVVAPSLVDAGGTPV